VEILAEVIASIIMLAIFLPVAALIAVAVLHPIMTMWRATFGPRRGNGRHQNNGGTS
jgi:hypothetical protein